MNRAAKTGIVFAVLAAALYAVSTPLSKLLLAHMPGTLMAGFLYIGAGVGMDVMAAVRKAKQKETSEARLTRADLPYTVAMIVLDIAARIVPRNTGAPSSAGKRGKDAGRRREDDVGEAFLKKGPPPHPLSKTFREEDEKCLRQCSSTNHEEEPQSTTFGFLYCKPTSFSLFHSSLLLFTWGCCDRNSPFAPSQKLLMRNKGKDTQKSFGIASELAGRGLAPPENPVKCPLR